MEEFSSVGTEGRIGEAMPNSNIKQPSHGGEIVASTSTQQRHVQEEWAEGSSFERSKLTKCPSPRGVGIGNHPQQFVDASAGTSGPMISLGTALPGRSAKAHSMPMT